MENPYNNITLTNVWRYSDVTTVLQLAHRLLRSGDCWTTGADAADIDGNAVAPYDPRAVVFSVIGAVKRSDVTYVIEMNTSGMPEPDEPYASDLALALLEYEAQPSDLDAFNDYFSHAEVLWMLQRTIDKVLRRQLEVYAQAA